MPFKTPRYKIAVDEAACGNAIECLKCVHKCLELGRNTLGYINKETPPVGQNAPKTLEEIDHKIISAFMFNCDGCGECVNICPKNALTLITPEPAMPRARYSRDGTIVICGTLANGQKKFPLKIQLVFLAFRFFRFLQRRGIRMKGLVADL